MRSLAPLLAELVPSIRSAYFPSRTGSVTTLTCSDLGAPFHCSVVPVSKSPRKRTSADAGAAGTSRIATINLGNRVVMDVSLIGPTCPGQRRALALLLHDLLRLDLHRSKRRNRPR